MNITSKEIQVRLVNAQKFLNRAEHLMDGIESRLSQREREKNPL